MYNFTDKKYDNFLSHSMTLHNRSDIHRNANLFIIYEIKIKQCLLLYPLYVKNMWIYGYIFYRILIYTYPFCIKS